MFVTYKKSDDKFVVATKSVAERSKIIKKLILGRRISAVAMFIYLVVLILT